MRKVVVLGVGLLVAVLGLGTTVGAPAGAAGTLAMRATTATTGLVPGTTVTVRITGASAGQVVRYGVCADGVPCAPAKSVRAGASGAATVSLTLTGTATYVDGGRTGVKACRPDRCHVAAHPDGRPASIVRLPLRFVGERVTAAVAPSAGLADGQVVTVTGRVRGAEGRIVRAVQIRGTDTATLGEARVAADGTFRLTGRVRRTLPGGSSCSPAPGSTAVPCVVETSVVGDPSHGIAATALRFLAPGLTATATPRTDLVDRQVVQVRGADPALAGRTVRVRQLACDVVDPLNPVCTPGPQVTVALDGQGRLAASLADRRFVGPLDCAASRYPVPDCSLEVTVLNSRQNPDTLTEVTRTTVFFRPF